MWLQIDSLPIPLYSLKILARCAIEYPHNWVNSSQIFQVLLVPTRVPAPGCSLRGISLVPLKVAYFGEENLLYADTLGSWWRIPAPYFQRLGNDFLLAAGSDLPPTPSHSETVQGRTWEGVLFPPGAGMGTRLKRDLPRGQKHGCPTTMSNPNSLPPCSTHTHPRGS